MRSAETQNPTSPFSTLVGRLLVCVPLRAWLGLDRNFSQGNALNWVVLQKI
jgi:hypothetical protein